MAGVQDVCTLSLLTVPGSHQTVALHGGPEAECQALSLVAQLRAASLYVMHGVTYQRSPFRELLDFLSKFTTEAVLVRVTPESFEANAANDMVQSVIDSEPNVWVTSGTPTMAQVRGKIDFLQKHPQETCYTVDRTRLQ